MKENVKRASRPRSAYRYYRRPYPNAADPRYFLDKLIDGVLAVSTGMGTLTIIFFLITM